MESIKKKGQAWYIGKYSTSSLSPDKKDTKPSQGVYLCFFEKSFVIVNFHQKDLQGSVNPYTLVDVIGIFSDKEKILRFLTNCFSHQSDNVQNVTTIYEFTDNGYWNKTVTKQKRLLSSVILPDKMIDGEHSSNFSDEILKDCHEFLESKKWYNDHGIPYRRCYLLVSPPGCGKSSFVSALAGELGYNLWNLSLSSKNMTDSLFASSMRQTHEKSIILVEDLDVAFPMKRSDKSFKKQQKKTNTKLTMSGFLNAMDGLLAPEGRIIFLTTNHIELLDSALIRPGRVDKIVRLSYATSDQIEKMCSRFLKKEHEDQTKLLIQTLPPDFLTMAELQSLFVRHKKDYSNIAAGVPDFLTTVFEERRRQEMLQEKQKEEEGKKEEEEEGREEKEQKVDGLVPFLAGLNELRRTSDGLVQFIAQ